MKSVENPDKKEKCEGVQSPGSLFLLLILSDADCSLPTLVPTVCPSSFTPSRTGRQGRMVVHHPQEESLLAGLLVYPSNRRLLYATVPGADSDQLSSQTADPMNPERFHQITHAPAPTAKCNSSVELDLYHNYVVTLPEYLQGSRLHAQDYPGI